MQLANMKCWTCNAEWVDMEHLSNSSHCPLVVAMPPKLFTQPQSVICLQGDTICLFLIHHSFPFCQDNTSYACLPKSFVTVLLMWHDQESAALVEALLETTHTWEPWNFKVHLGLKWHMWFKTEHDSHIGQSFNLMKFNLDESLKYLEKNLHAR